MANEEKDAAKLAGRAKTQGKNAARNGIKAVEAAAEPVIDSVAEEIHDTAQKAEETVEDVLGKFPPRLIKQVAKDGLVGTVAATVSIYAAKIALDRFVDAVGFTRGYKRALREPVTRSID